MTNMRLGKPRTRLSRCLTKTLETQGSLAHDEITQSAAYNFNFVHASVVGVVFIWPTCEQIGNKFIYVIYKLYLVINTI
jgi:hypothetical protein